MLNRPRFCGAVNGQVFPSDRSKLKTLLTSKCVTPASQVNRRQRSEWQVVWDQYDLAAVLSENREDTIIGERPLFRFGEHCLGFIVLQPTFFATRDYALYSSS